MCGFFLGFFRKRRLFVFLLDMSKISCRGPASRINFFREVLCCAVGPGQKRKVAGGWGGVGISLNVLFACCFYNDRLLLSPVRLGTYKHAAMPLYSEKTVN